MTEPHVWTSLQSPPTPYETGIEWVGQEVYDQVKQWLAEGKTVWRVRCRQMRPDQFCATFMVEDYIRRALAAGQNVQCPCPQNWCSIKPEWILNSRKGPDGDGLHDRRIGNTLADLDKLGIIRSHVPDYASSQAAKRR